MDRLDPRSRNRVGAAGGPAVELDGAAAEMAGRPVWRDVSASIARGEFVALLGANGAGKSTLLKVLLGAVPVSEGSVRVLGRAPGRANRDIGYLPQRHWIEQGARLRGADIVRLGLDGDRWGLPLPSLWPGGGARARARDARARVADALHTAGATAYAGRSIGELSGGEQQRVLIAQALVRRPDLLLLDEPLDSLDLPNQAAIAALVNTICRERGVGVLLVAHDVNPLLPYLDRVIYLAGGRALVGTVDEVITGEQLTRLHGVPVEVLRASDGRLVVVGTPDVPAHHHDRHADAHAHGGHGQGGHAHSGHGHG